MKMNRVIIIFLLVHGLWYTTHSQCYQPSVINPNVICPTIWDPVCGCDGKIYSNACVALNRYGITSWSSSGVVEVNPDSPLAICKGETIQLTAGSGISYAWNTGEVTRSISINPEKNTTYNVTTSYESGCHVKTNFNILVSPAYSITENITITNGESYHSWSTPGTYIRNLKTKNGCDSIVTTHLSVTGNPAIVLKTGWNIISTFLIPSNMTIDAFFQSLINDGSLIKVQDENGYFLENLGTFGGWVNKIGNISPSEGYKVKVAHDCQLQIYGTFVVLPLTIELKTGWNIVGFPQNTQKDASETVQELIDRGTLVKVQDEKGNSLEDLGVFGGWKNNIGMFQPGKGYKIKVTKNEILTIQ
jgi:hypothetical protein